MKHREGVRRPAGEETDRRDGLPGSQLPEKIFVDDRWFRFRLDVSFSLYLDRFPAPGAGGWID